MSCNKDMSILAVLNVSVRKIYPSTYRIPLGYTGLE